MPDAIKIFGLILCKKNMEGIRGAGLKLNAPGIRLNATGPKLTLL